MSEEEKINQSRADSQQTEENKTVEQPLTINNEPITNMEVHHHPHVEKKNFKEYFLEFLMIFLAVTMGFFAENIREHYTEKNDAREYLESYRDELLQQKKVFAVYKTLYQKKVIVCDSIKNIFFMGKENNQLPLLARLMLFGVQNIEVPLSTPSYDQMI